MKTAITVSLENAFPKALVVFRGLDRAIPLIAELGYDGIELALWRAETVDRNRLHMLIDKYKLSIPVISTGQVYTVEKVSFTHPDESIRNRAVEIMINIVEFARELGADVNISRVKGSWDEREELSVAMDRLSDCIRRINDVAEKYGVRLLLEQMNMYESNILNSLTDVGDFIRTLGSTNIKIHADTFHMNIHDANWENLLTKYSDDLGYIHFSDSNRLYPGGGNIDFDAVVKILHRIGYEKWIGIEVFAIPNDIEAARFAIQHVRKIYKRNEITDPTNK